MNDSPSMTMLQGHFTGIQNLNAELSQIATKLYKRDLLQPDKIITLRFPEQRTVSVPRFILPDGDEVEIKDISPVSFEKLLLYLYSGDIPKVIPGRCHTWWSLLVASEKFGITKFSDLCRKEIEECLKKHLKCSLLMHLEACLQNPEDILITNCIKTKILQNTGYLLRNSAFLSCDIETVKYLIQEAPRKGKYKVEELKLFEGLVRWCINRATHDLDPSIKSQVFYSLGVFKQLPVKLQRLSRKYVVQLFPHIQFKRICVDDYLDIIQPSGILTDHQLSLSSVIILNQHRERNLLSSLELNGYLRSGLPGCFCRLSPVRGLMSSFVSHLVPPGWIKTSALKVVCIGVKELLYKTCHIPHVGVYYP